MLQNLCCEKSSERRRVGDQVEGRWLKARMKFHVKNNAGEDQKERAEKFNTSDKWLNGFAKRKGLSYRKKTNKKSLSAIKRSLRVRRFHWYAIYKARLLPPKRSAEWKKMVEDKDPLTL